MVTFNIELGRQVERAANLLDRSAVLRGADILLVQELDAAGTGTLAQRLRMNFVYVPSAILPGSSRDFGVAILSRWPLSSAHKVLLPGQHALRKTRRSAAAATVHTPFGEVRAYAVHFETPFGAPDSVRRAQARAVLADASSWRGPVVIGGDFNGTDAGDELAKAGFTWLTRRVHDTAGPFDFDHIVVRGFCPLSPDRGSGRAAAPAAAGRGPAASGISDHRPVWATVWSCP